MLRHLEDIKDRLIMTRHVHFKGNRQRVISQTYEKSDTITLSRKTKVKEESYADNLIGIAEDPSIFLADSG